MSGASAQPLAGKHLIGLRLGMWNQTAETKVEAISLTVGYNLMSDFDEAVGGSRNDSGPEFSLGFGYVFGGGDAARPQNRPPG